MVSRRLLLSLCYYTVSALALLQFCALNNMFATMFVKCVRDSASPATVLCGLSQAWQSSRHLAVRIPSGHCQLASIYSEHCQLMRSHGTATPPWANATTSRLCSYQRV